LIVDGLPPVSGQQLAALAPFAPILGQGVIVFARIVGMLMVMPFFGSMNIPMVVRVGFAFTLAIVITPSVADSIIQMPGDTPAFVLLLVNQLLIGLMLGLVAAFTFYGIESAGRIIDTQRGSNMSDIIAPQSGERTSPSGQWMMMLALVMLLATGQHMTIINGMIQSFHVLPATGSMDWIGDNDHPKLIREFAALSSNMLVIAVKVAAPAMLSILLSDCLLGIINRGAPQVNVFMLSMPIKAILGIAAMSSALAATVFYMTGSHGAFQELLGKPGGNGLGGDFGHILRLMRN
jgi:flagellar biosynthetic protein FliR